MVPSRPADCQAERSVQCPACAACLLPHMPSEFIYCQHPLLTPTFCILPEHECYSHVPGACPHVACVWLHSSDGRCHNGSPGMNIKQLRKEGGSVAGGARVSGVGCRHSCVKKERQEDMASHGRSRDWLGASRGESRVFQRACGKGAWQSTVAASQGCWHLGTVRAGCGFKRLVWSGGGRREEERGWGQGLQVWQGRYSFAPREGKRTREETERGAARPRADSRQRGDVVLCGGGQGWAGWQGGHNIRAAEERCLGRCGEG